MQIKNNKFKAIEVLIHFFAWIVAFGFPLVFTDRERGLDWNRYIHHCLVLLGYLIVFYVNYLYLAPHFLFKDKIKYFFLWNIVLVLSFTMIRFFWDWGGAPPPPNGRPFGPPRYFFFVGDLIMFSFIAGLGATIQISMRWRLLEEKLVESEKQKTDAELKNLKNQLNPHFLLNTLNNIYALIDFNQEKAQESVQELSKMLRYMLYEDQSDFVSLEKEFEFIRNYVSLMKIRLPENVSVQLSLEEEKDSHIKIAPFIFISLIENAFKHGVSSQEESFIQVAIKGKTNGKVSCEISNSYFPKAAEDKSGHGIGLEQVQKRLDLLYPNQYEWMKGVKDSNVYYSSLIIQTKD